MKLFKQTQNPPTNAVSQLLSYENIKAIRYCLYDNAPELGKPCLHKLDNKSRYKFEIQLWEQEHNSNTGNIKLNGWLSNGKVFRQTKDYKRLQPYKNWYVENWDLFKNKAQMDFSAADLVGFTCMLQRQQNGASNGNTIIPQMTAMLIVHTGFNPQVHFQWNDLMDVQDLTQNKDKEGYNIFYHYKQVET